MSCESDSDGILSKRAKTKTRIVNDNETEDNPHTNHKGVSDRIEPEKIEKGENNVENNGPEKKRASKRSRESDVESSVTSDEDAMSKKRVRKDSDDECLSKPRKFISAATKKRREAVRSAREKRAALESDSEDDSEELFLVNRKVGGKVRSDSEKSVESSDDSVKSSDDQDSKSQETVSVEKENRKDTNKVDSTLKNDDSSSAYNSDTEGENPSSKKGNSVGAEKKSFASSKGSDESSSDNPAAGSPKRKSPDVTKSLSVEDKENSSLKQNESHCKKPVNGSKESVEKETDSGSEAENRVSAGEELRNDELQQRAKCNKSPSSSSSDNEPVKKTVKSEAPGHDSDSYSNSPLKSKKSRMKHLKSVSSGDDSSSSDDSAPLKKTKSASQKTKQMECKQVRKVKSSGLAKKQSNIEESDESTGSNSEDETLKKAKKSSDTKTQVKSEKRSEIKSFKRKTKASDQVSDGSSESDEPLSKMNNVRKLPGKNPRNIKLEDERESDTSENEKERASSSSSEEEVLSNVSTKKSEQKREVKHSLSDSEDSGKENKSKGKGDDGKLRNESGEQSKVKHEISSSEDSDAPLKKSHKKEQEVQKKSKSRSSSSDSSEKDDQKPNKNAERKSAGEKRIDRMKKYVYAAGIRVSNYAVLWKDCKNQKQKLEKLLGLLEDRGLKGNPTLKKCKKLRKKYEQKREVEDLDLNNIIDNEEEAGRGRRSRTRSSAPPPPPPPPPTHRSSFSLSVDKKEQEEAAEREAEFKERFSRIKKAFGSSSSGSD